MSVETLPRTNEFAEIVYDGEVNIVENGAVSTLDSFEEKKKRTMDRHNVFSEPIEDQFPKAVELVLAAENADQAYGIMTVASVNEDQQKALEKVLDCQEVTEEEKSDAMIALRKITNLLVANQ